MFRTGNDENDSKLFCSELVAEFHQSLGLLSRSHPASEYTPQDFRRDILHFTSTNIGFSREFIDIKCPDFDLFNVAVPPNVSFPGAFQVKLPDGRLMTVRVPRKSLPGQKVRVIAKKPEPKQNRTCVCQTCSQLLTVGPYMELFQCGVCGAINNAKLCKMVGSPETLGKDSGEESRRQVALKHFQKFDEDKSGTIERAELRHMLLRFNFPSNLIDSEFDRADVNKSGDLDFEEFFSYYSNLQMRSKKDVAEASEILKSKENLIALEKQLKDVLERNKRAEESLEATTALEKRRKIELHNRSLEVQDELMKLSHQLHDDHLSRAQEEIEKNNEAKKRLALRKQKRKKGSSRKLGRKVSGIAKIEKPDEKPSNAQVVEIEDTPTWVVHESPDGKCFLYNPTTGETKPVGGDSDEESESEDSDSEDESSVII